MSDLVIDLDPIRQVLRLNYSRGINRPSGPRRLSLDDAAGIPGRPLRRHLRWL
jgi:hypothetical protein